METQAPRLPQGLLSRIERSTLPPAVVVGTDVTGLTVARALARHGVPVIGVDGELRRYTGYSSSFHLLVTPTFEEEGFIGYLEKLARALPRRAALFLSMDHHVTEVAERGQHLRELFHFEFPSPETVEVLMSKQRFTALAREKGWPIPETHHCETVAEVEALAPGLTYPVILKPQVKVKAFRENSPKKAFMCQDAAQLLADYRLMAQWEKEAVIQQWIPGGDEEVYFSLHYLDASLREVASFEGKKIRQFIPRCGSTSSAVGVRHRRISDLSLRILQETACAGFGSVEYKRDPRTDRFYIVEPTVGRVDLQVGVSGANRVDIISQAYFHLVGREYPVRQEPTSDTKWILLRSDFKSARYYISQGEYTWREYARSMRGPKVFAVWRADDPGMIRGFARDWSGKPWRVLRRAVRRWRGAALQARRAGQPV